MEKVKVTQKLADAIETMKAKGSSLNEIVERHVHKDHMHVNGYELVEQLPTDTLIRALYIGFEVEETLEDKVRKYYELLDPYTNRTVFNTLEVQGIIEKVLNLLNIKIEGVNA